MKRILCLFLSFLCLTFGNVTSVCATEESPELKEALTLFQAMELISGSEDLKKELTRGDFAVYIAEFLKVDLYEDDSRSFFTDVADTLWAKTAINALADRQYISGAGGLFRPEDNITGLEALKVFLMLSGYNAEAEQRGGYPNGYLAASQRLKLLSGIVISDTLSYGDYLTLLYRTVKLDYMKIESIIDGNMVYFVDRQETVLGFYHNIYYARGRVTAVGKMSLTGKSYCKDNEVIINDVLYTNLSDKPDFYSYFGLETEIYYQTNNREEKNILCVLDQKDLNDVLTIYGEDFLGITDNVGYYSIRYTDEFGKEHTANIDRGGIILENGVSVLENVKSALTLTHGYIYLVDYDRDSIYDMAMVYEGYDMIIGSINNETDDVVTEMHSMGGFYYMRGEVGNRVLLYDLYDADLAVDISKARDRIIRLKNANNEFIEYSDLNVGDIVTVFKSDDNTHVEVVKGLGSVSGVIDSWSSSSFEIFLEGESYRLTQRCVTNHTDEIFPGKNGRFMLNFLGDVAHIKFTSESDIKLAYLFDMNYRNSGLQEQLQFKLFTQDGAIRIVNVAESVRIDNEIVKTYAEIVNKVSNNTAALERQMVCFGVNEANRLNYLDLAGVGINESDDTLIQSGQGSGVYYVGAKKLSTIPNCVFDNTKTKVFVVPTDDSFKNGEYEDDWFAVKKLTELDSGNIIYDMLIYRVGVHSDFEDAILIKKRNEWGLAARTIPLLINEIKTGINDEGEFIHIVSAYSSGRNPTKYYTKDLSALQDKNLEKGDLVWFMFDLQGRIDNVKEIFYTAAGGKQFEGEMIAYSGTDQNNLAVSTSKGASMCLESAYATELCGNVLRYGYEIGDIDGACIVPISIHVIVKGEGSNPGIYYGSITEIADYLRAGNDCTKLLIRSGVYSANQIYIYR